MNKKIFLIRNQSIRRNVYHAIAALPLDDVKPYVVEIKELTRSLDQNAKMWAVLSDIADQVIWHGNKLTAEEWKHMLSASLGKQKVYPNIDGDGFVVMGISTSRMSVSRMRDLIELAQAFGAEQGVEFGDSALEAMMWASERKKIK